MTRIFRKNLIRDILSLLVILFIGVLIFLGGAFPRTIEIDPTGKEVTAKLYTRSSFPPFNKSEFSIPNIKQAVITKTSSRKIFPTYKVDLESYSGYKFSITTDFLGYFLKRRLQKQINTSIQNKTPFKKAFIDIWLSICGIIIILLTILSILLDINGIKLYKKWNKRRKEKYKEKKDFEISLKGNIEPEQKEYNNINDSIIKK